MKLIKINTNHYVVVDDSEITTGDIVAEKLLTDKYELFTIHTLNDIDKQTQKKITHSTQPLETSNEVWEDSFKRYDYITLQEIKENFCWLDGREWEVELVDGKLKLR